MRPLRQVIKVAMRGVAKIGRILDRKHVYIKVTKETKEKNS